MRQANTVCLIAILFFMSMLAGELCFGLNPSHLGGWGPAMMMLTLPLVAYALGRVWGTCTE